MVAESFAESYTGGIHMRATYLYFGLSGRNGLDMFALKVAPPVLAGKRSRASLVPPSASASAQSTLAEVA